MLPKIGKVDKETFDKIIFSQLGKKDDTVLIGPRHGVDAAVIDLGNKVMVITLHALATHQSNLQLISLE